jgi:tetratricopeptide (TPR) repeat protein
VLSKLGLVEFKQGNFLRAIEVLEDVLDAIGLGRRRLRLPVPVRLLVSVLASLLPLPRWRGPTEQAEVAIRTRALLAECYFMAGDPTRTSHHSVAAANLARRLGPNPESVRALVLNGFGMVLYGQIGLGKRTFARARAYCQAIHARESVRSRLDVAEAVTLLVQGEVAEAIERLEDAWRLYGTAASAEARVHVIGWLVLVLTLAGHERRRCEHYLRRMQALAEELHDTRLLGATLAYRGHLLLCDGRLGPAIDELRRALRLSLQAGDRITVLRVHDLLVVALALAGELDEALDLGRTAAEAALDEASLRHLQCRDAGLVVAAAEVVRRGQPLPAGVEALVHRVLRHRRRDALALPTAAPLFLVAEAAWHRVHGRAHDLAAPIAAAERMGLRGEATLARLVARRFDPAEAEAGPRAEPRALRD